MGGGALGLFTQPTAEWFLKTYGEPTEVQKEAWPAIAGDRPVLVSAPTGTGKTLSAFLVFIDRLYGQAVRGTLKEGVQLIYVSPLKSLAADIRENLQRPLDGIADGAAARAISVGIRTGDTPQKERRYMVKHPPHILITTPESLFLMLTSGTGRSVLESAQAVVIDELHALIDTKRGAHLLLSVARLEALCGHPLQRIGLSATIEPLELAAQWLSPEPSVIVAPKMRKAIEIRVSGSEPQTGRSRDPIWEQLAQKVYERCQQNRSVIAFSEGRRYAEKLAYYVNQIAGEDFALVHHGSLSKEQRQSAEQRLREGKLRLLCATSSMELGIDVGEVDEVLQIGCPRTVSSTMQRLGRSGHGPGRVSVMYMYPRTAPEGLYCGMTAALARSGSVEEANPPRQCLDVLAQHLVSMAAGSGRAGKSRAAGSEQTGQSCAAEDARTEQAHAAENVRTEQTHTAGSGQAGRSCAAGSTQSGQAAYAYSVDDVMAILRRAWPFSGVDRETVKSLLCMLAGDDEHRREIPVRPRVLYDRIHELVWPDPYSRLLAVSAGGTIPDRGMYAAKTPEGVKVGELDEEFVYESRVGDRFLLGSFGWKIVGQDKDTVFVEPASAASARLPFWHGEIRGRGKKTGIAFGKMLGALEKAQNRGGEALLSALAGLGLDDAAAQNAADFLNRQIAATGCLPGDKTVLVEYFRDHAGNGQMMVHCLFGRRLNAPLALLARHAAAERFGQNVGVVDEENGILLYAYGKERIPEGILQSIDPGSVRKVLEAALLQTPVFNMTFRYNAARALMMGMRPSGRQPLWMQRLRGTELLDSLVSDRTHPLIAETVRECLEDIWDLEGVLWLLSGIRSGLITVREVYTEVPSPMSLPLQWEAEAAEMYEYAPTTSHIRRVSDTALEEAEGIRPDRRELERAQERERLPEDPEQLHSLLMMEGDLEAGELAVPGEWLEALAENGRACYIEPGLWIAAEHREEYALAFGPSSDAADGDRAGYAPDFGFSSNTEIGDRAGHDAASEVDGRPEAPVPGKQTKAGDAADAGSSRGAAAHIVRRMLYYRGPGTAEGIEERYFLPAGSVRSVLETLLAEKSVVEEDGIFYHAKRYQKARRDTIRALRREAETRPPERYARLIAERTQIPGSPADQLREALERLAGCPFPAALWEETLLPARVRAYRGNLLDSLLAEGDFFWHILPDGNLCFERAEDAEDTVLPPEPELEGEERALYEQLKARGASFAKQLAKCIEGVDVLTPLLSLAQKGLVCADSFVPVRQWMERDKLERAAVRQRVSAKVTALSAGRWDLVRPVRKTTAEEWLERQFRRSLIVCRETWKRPESCPEGKSWSDALAVLRVWEYVGKVRRGYFVSGMSGAQFIRQEDYVYVTGALAEREGSAQNSPPVLWLNAADPACLWGKCLPHFEGRAFLNVPGTAAALWGGRPAAVFERKGRVLRVFEPEILREALELFVLDFRARRLYAGTKRLIVKEYPQEAAEALRAAGFLKEMQDYVLYL